MSKKFAVRVFDAGNLKWINSLACLVILTTQLGTPSYALTEQDLQTAMEPLSSAEKRDGSIPFINSVKAMWDAKDWTSLDGCADSIRKSKAAWSDGLWKLDTFYDVVSSGSVRKKKPEQEVLAVISKLQQWVKAKPNSITARIALANEMYRYAWHARGGGYIDSVTEEAKAKMTERENAALQILNFEKATSLQPRWQGEPGDWERFTAESADKVGGAAGDELYAQIVWKIDATHWYTRPPLFATFKLDWPRTKRGFESLCAKNKNDLRVLNEYCKLACTTERPVAAQLFVRLAGRCDTDIWQDILFDGYRKSVIGSARSELQQ